MKALRIFALLVLVAAAFAAGYGYGRWYGLGSGNPAAEQETGKPKYYCPMHPSYVSDKPGDCPVCGMKLVPLETAAGPEEEAPPPPAGAIYVSPDKQQLIGVKYGYAEVSAPVRTIRAAGKVGFDETRIARVQTRIDGWIDQVFVDFTGKLVQKGQPLLTLYSPEMLASQQEFLLALKSRDLMAASPLPGAKDNSESMIAAARKRLELWELSDTQIDRVARTGEPIRNITLNSPISGYVVARNAYPKQRITPETELYTVVDLSRVWVMASVFENEAPDLHMGAPATISLPYGGGRTIAATVQYIQPQVDPATRTVTLRLEAENPDLQLKPDMFVDVDFRLASQPRVTVPQEAVLNTGARQVVFVDRGNGYLEPREVEAGESASGRTAVLSGLKPGERVVSSGTFLIDAESRLRPAGTATAAPVHQHGGSGAQPAPGGHSHD